MSELEPEAAEADLAEQETELWETEDGDDVVDDERHVQLDDEDE